MSDRLFAALARDPLLIRQRRALIVQHARLTGIDRVEAAPEQPAGLTRLLVDFIPSGHRDKPPIPDFSPANVVVTRSGADGAAVYGAALRRPDRHGRTLTVDLPRIEHGAGEEATYVLEIQDVDEIDPLFARATFSRIRSRATEFDPAPSAAAASAPSSAPAINYLAKDFQSFRQLMLDQMAVRVPAWRESHPADMVNTVIDILAYAGDYLSYYQDAVATEAYLGTARRRVSVRRHARLVDYRMHEGCAARVWLRIEVTQDCTIERGLRVACEEPGPLPEDSFEIGGKLRPPRGGRALFETLEPATLYLKHNQLAFHHWGVRDFRLAKGATSAALRGNCDKLRCGDVLIFAAATHVPGAAADISALAVGPAASATEPAMAAAAEAAFEGRCHAVRLTRAPRLSKDRLSGEEITEIAWAAADALPFDLPVATESGEPTAVAWGNIVAADTGFTFVNGRPQPAAHEGGGRVRLRLPIADLIYAVPYDPHIERARSAAAFTHIDPVDAVPAISLAETGGGETWTARPDLLDSDRFARDFVVESDHDGAITLRFGDDVHGLRPAPGTVFGAVYRVGWGERNVAAMSILAWDKRPGDAIRRISNPFPAGGGTARQPLREVQRDAPEAFRALRQCVAAQDYADVVKRDPRVRDAVAETRWIGSGRAVFIHVQPADGGDLDAALSAALTAELERRRILGHVFALRPPVHVPLRIALTLTVESSQAPDAVRRAVMQAVADLYRSDRMQFGVPVFLSPLVTKVMGVPGVADVRVDEFHRYATPPLGELAAGRINLAPTEIARLDNRADAPARGRLTVKIANEAAQTS